MNDLILNRSACDKDVDTAQIMELLPPWKTHILEATIINKEIFPTLSLRFLLNAHTEEEIKKWLAQLQDANKTTYSIYCTANSTGKYVNFKQRLVCQHNTRSQNVYDPSIRSRTSTKNTNCPSKMTVVLHAIKKRYQGKDKEKYKLLGEMPCEVTFIATHNHATLSADSLRFRKMSDEVKEKLLNLFHNGHSASTALESLKTDIQLNNDNYEEILVDRKYCPTYDDCYHLYRQQFEKKYGPIWSNNMDNNMIADKGGQAEHIAIEYTIGTEIMDEEVNTNNNDSSVETAKASAKAVLANINEVFSQFIDRSPVEVAAGLDSMFETLQKIKNPSTFTSCCINFGSGIHRKIRGGYIGVQSTAISRRKTNLSGKRSHVGGRTRKTANNRAVRKSSVGHNLSKEVPSNQFNKKMAPQKELSTFSENSSVKTDLNSPLQYNDHSDRKTIYELQKQLKLLIEDPVSLNKRSLFVWKEGYNSPKEFFPYEQHYAERESLDRSNSYRHSKEDKLPAKVFNEMQNEKLSIMPTENSSVKTSSFCSAVAYNEHSYCKTYVDLKENLISRMEDKKLLPMATHM